MRSFAHYDDARLARGVWESYFPRGGVSNEAKEIYNSCSKHDDLDLRLDELLNSRSVHVCSGAPRPLHEEEDYLFEDALHRRDELDDLEEIAIE